ncbi:MAG: 50S ribosomal protein L25 [Anaerolineales bacterium]|jgi:large subunit ribosomal protein L25
MAKIELQAEKRTKVGGGLFSLRSNGKIPAVIYGPSTPSQPIQLEGRQAARIIDSLAGSDLISLKIDGKDHDVLLRDVQRDSIRRTILHVDFYEVPTDRLIRVRIRLEFVGSAPAVRDFGGVLVHLIDELEAECLPKDLVGHLQVDLNGLSHTGDSIAVKDVPLPPGIRLLMDPDEDVVTVTEQAKEEVVEAAPAVVTPEVELVRKEKAEEAPEKETEEE